MGDTTSDTSAHIATELRVARARRRLSQVKLAEMSGLPPHVIARIETEERPAKVEQIVAIARALDMPVSVFIPG